MRQCANYGGFWGGGGLTSLITGRHKQVKTKDCGGLKSTYNFLHYNVCSTAFSNNI